MKRTTVWTVAQWAALMGLIATVWPLPLWRYLLVLVLGLAMQWTERNWWRAHQRELNR